MMWLLLMLSAYFFVSLLGMYCFKELSARRQLEFFLCVGPITTLKVSLFRGRELEGTKNARAEFVELN